MTSCWGTEKMWCHNKGQLLGVWLMLGVGQRMVYNSHTNSNPQSVIWGLGLTIWVEAHLLPFLIREAFSFEPTGVLNIENYVLKASTELSKTEGRGAEREVRQPGVQVVKVLSPPHLAKPLGTSDLFAFEVRGILSIKLQGSLLQPLSPWIQLPLCSGQLSRGLQEDQTTPVTSEWTCLSKLTHLFSPFQQPMFGF